MLCGYSLGLSLLVPFGAELVRETGHRAPPPINCLSQYLLLQIMAPSLPAQHLESPYPLRWGSKQFGRCPLITAFEIQKPGACLCHSLALQLQACDSGPFTQRNMGTWAKGGAGNTYGPKLCKIDLTPACKTVLTHVGLRHKHPTPLCLSHAPGTRQGNASSWCS